MDIDPVTKGRWMGGTLCQTAAWNRAECCPPSQPGSLQGGLPSQVERESFSLFLGAWTCFVYLFVLL